VTQLRLYHCKPAVSGFELFFQFAIDFLQRANAEAISSECISRIAAVARSIVSALRDRALRLRPSTFLTMTCLQGRDDVDEACSLTRVHLALPRPAICLRFRDDSLCFVEFGAMHFEEGGVCSEVSAV
jgi:hypothetical protein